MYLHLTSRVSVVHVRMSGIKAKAVLFAVHMNWFPLSVLVTDKLCRSFLFPLPFGSVSAVPGPCVRKLFPSFHFSVAGSTPPAELQVSLSSLSTLRLSELKEQVGSA